MNLKPLWIVAVAASVAFALAPQDADAKRLGGARSSGMQRSAPPPQQQNATPPTQAQPNNPAAPNAAAAPAAGTAAAAAAPKRSWLGPVAGLAAGLGLAALFSHLGLGAELANFVMLMLLALVAFVVIRMLMRRFGAGAAAPQRSPMAMAGAGPASPRSFPDERPGMQRSATPTGAAPSVTIGSALKPPLAVPGVTSGRSLALPADFDVPGFERLAKMLFIRMQAANDNADLNDLRQFTTPELFSSLRLDLQDRGDAKQHTDVVKVEAELIDFAQEDGRQIVSVRYTGQVRESEDAPGAAPSAFDEVWHLVKPADDSRAWAIAGIQQRESA